MTGPDVRLIAGGRSKPPVRAEFLRLNLASLASVREFAPAVKDGLSRRPRSIFKPMIFHTAS